MNQFSHLHLNSGIRVEVVERERDLEKEVKKEIDRIWETEAKKKGKTLFNGKILSMVKFNGKTMIAEYIDFKYALAQLINPELSKKLRIQPVGITAITSANNHILIGKRSSNVAVYPGRFELAPAGTVSDEVLKEGEADLKKQLLTELQEEIGIEPCRILQLAPTLLVKDPTLGYVEVCYRIEVEPSVMAEAKFSREEYDEVLWLTPKESLSHIQQHRSEYVPMSIYLLNQIS